MLVNLSVARHGLANLTIRPDLVTVPLTGEPPPAFAQVPVEIRFLHADGRCRMRSGSGFEQI